MLPLARRIEHAVEYLRHDGFNVSVELACPSSLELQCWASWDRVVRDPQTLSQKRRKVSTVPVSGIGALVHGSAGTLEHDVDLLGQLLHLHSVIDVENGESSSEIG